MANRISHQEIVKKLLDTKAVDFGNIAKVVAEVGPTISMADEPWDGFCGTMRRFVHIFILNPGVTGNPVENLGQLRGVAGELND